uniref:Serine/threonine-protein phosphatase n=1 Tax=Rhizophora mucronata TaxID=61149 RepID=A0A2P2QUD9_RHIMU
MTAPIISQLIVSLYVSLIYPRDPSTEEREKNKEQQSKIKEMKFEDLPTVHILLQRCHVRHFLL